MKRDLFLSALLILFVSIPLSAKAGLKSFVKEYTYQASEMDSKVTCRTNALEQVKRLLLEQLGTYLISHTTMANYTISQDKITTLTAGLVEARILKETWNGEEYWLRAEIKADPDAVAESVEKLHNDWDQREELETVHRQLEAALAQNEKLKKELHSAAEKGPSPEQAQQYTENMNKIKALNLFSEARASQKKGNSAEALKLVKEAIDLDPAFQQAYGLLGRIFKESGQDGLAKQHALNVLKRDFNPADPETYILRGFSYQLLKKNKEAVAEYSLGIKLNPDVARFYRFRSNALVKLRKTRQALTDAEKAVSLEPGDYRNYLARGIAYSRARKPDQGLADLNKAIEINPKAGQAYYTRGLFYKNNKIKQDSAQAKRDFAEACRLGLQRACQEL